MIEDDRAWSPSEFLNKLYTLWVIFFFDPLIVSQVVALCGMSAELEARTIEGIGILLATDVLDFHAMGSFLNVGPSLTCFSVDIDSDEGPCTVTRRDRV